MKVLLADPPALERAYDDSYANLGLLYLAGYLREKKYSLGLKIDYLGPKHDLVSHIKSVKDFAPDIYGISFTSKTAELAYKTIKKVKEAMPKVVVVCGGAHPTAMPEEVMKKSLCDICVVGEGEITFSDIVKKYTEEEFPDLNLIDGILYRNGEGYRENTKRAFIKNIDDIPFPAWDLIDFADYPGMHLKKQPIESSLLISRGCPFDCAFCSNPVWKSSKPWLRHRSIDNICKEIDLLYSKGVREIYMSSDEINFNEKWAIELCKKIKQRNYADLYFQCNMRVDKVSKEFASNLKNINCWMVHIGVESANDRVLNGIGKYITVEQIDNATKTLSEAGIKVFAFTMLYNVWEKNGVLDFETTSEVDNTIKFVKKLFNKRQIHYMSWQFCTPMPGSRLYFIAKKHNLYRKEQTKIWETFDEHDVAMRLPGITERTMRWKIKKGILLKDWFMIKSGQINLKHMWRVAENIKALLR